jgi:putative heme-binding domain-containing protein
MQRFVSTCSLFLLGLPLYGQEWKPLFNGRNLDGWTGDPRLWRVENGVLIGETDDADRKLAANSFLILKDAEVADFELEYQARVTGGNNSGVQYRSKVLDPKQWVVGGYQMDLHPEPRYLGMLYEEKGRGIACESGQKVDLADKPTVTGSLDRPATNLAEWNTYRIVAKGDTATHYINDKPVAEIHDVDAAKRSLKGVLALQVHAGPSMKAEFKELRLRTFAPTAASTPAKPTAATSGQGTEPTVSWIWQSASPADIQKVYFRREFSLPRDIISASLTVTCDNWQRVWVNGKDLGFTSEWGAPANHDVMKHIVQGGRNVIAVEGRNQDGSAGMALRFSATLKGGRKAWIVSDEKWQASLEAPRGWQEPRFTPRDWAPAVSVAKMGEGPWGMVLQPDAEGGTLPVDVSSKYQLLPGFKLERLYQVPNVQGSWVAMTVDGTGKLLCADQYGKIYRVTPAAKPDQETIVTPTAIPLAGAHGLLWHQGVLWVTVNEGPEPAGVYRVTDSDRDGEPDKAERVLSVKGNGEHGPHALVPSPDGKFIYFVAGNFTDLAEMKDSMVPKVWKEDQLLPRRPDARGHAQDRFAPGGWVARCDLDGSNWTLVAMGFRNTYDIAFNANGDLFGYDSDMEWDLGMPWYRPTRICHIVPGAEFGWRHGTGPWPTYYEDSVPPLVEMGPGSPTGMLSGKDTKFPAKYQRALYAFDWTYATIHAIHVTPSGQGYKAEREEFLAGSGMPLTDAAIGKDGAMYFMTGGRRTASALWRVTYTGSESVAPVRYEAKEATVASKEGAWDGLGSADRMERYNSRVAIELAGPGPIAQKLATEKDPWKVIEGSIALARTGTSQQRGTVIDALLGLDWATLDVQQKLNWLRAAGLAFARHGEPTADERTKMFAKIDAAFPSNQSEVDRELCRMLCYLQAPGIVGRTLALMDTTGPTPAPDWLAVAKRNAQYGADVEKMINNLPPAQVIHYMYCLRVVKGPWSQEERKRFFAWFGRLVEKSGGASYAGFIQDLRKQTLETATPEEREWISKMAPATTANPLANLPPVEGPGREWTVAEVEKLAAGGLSGRSKENGKKMYQASLCAACHRFDGEGGSAGPDLTAVGGRFTVKDLAESILEPSKVVSDQYAFDTIIKHDGSQVVGKLIEEKDEHWIIATSPFDFSSTSEIERSQIKDIKPSPVSPMPAGLINRLNPEELKDLLAYLLAK